MFLTSFIFDKNNMMKIFISWIKKLKISQKALLDLLEWSHLLMLRVVV